MTPKVRAAGLLGYVDIARSVGLDPFAMLQERGIKASELEDTEWMISARATIGLLEASAERAGRQDFGVLIASNRSYSHFGPVSLLLQHLETPREVVNAIVEFRHLLGDTVTIGIEDRDDVALVKLSPLIDELGFQLMSMCVATAYRVLSDSSGGLWQPECVHFMSPRPADTTSFTRFFRTDLEFGSTFDGFSCPPRALAVRNSLADSVMARHARNLLKLMRGGSHQEKTLDHTKYSISLLMGSGQATLAGVAANLGISQRSLQRALENEGSSFAGLLNETRRQFAVRFLRESSLSVGEIATMVGYACSSSFSRWFANEFNETPLAFRARFDRRRRNLGFGEPRSD